MNLQEIQKQIDTKNGRINDLQIELRKKDYIGTKIAMGRATREQYQGEIAQCNEWAEEIDGLMTEVNELMVQKKTIQDEIDNAPHEII